MSVGSRKLEFSFTYQVFSTWFGAFSHRKIQNVSLQVTQSDLFIRCLLQEQNLQTEDPVLWNIEVPLANIPRSDILLQGYWGYWVCPVETEQELGLHCQS